MYLRQSDDAAYSIDGAICAKIFMNGQFFFSLSFDTSEKKNDVKHVLKRNV